jgi:hypothetical protein
LNKPPDDDLFREETDDRLVADRRNFSKVELWTKDGLHVEQLLFAGNSLDRARAVLATFAKKRPRGRLTIRQRSRVQLVGPRSTGVWGVVRAHVCLLMTVPFSILIAVQ